MALIELRKISKAYGSVPALRELDLTVPEGCLYGLLGPNGAGKTTAMRILATLLAPDSGSVVVGGVDGLVQPREVRQLMGYVAQEVAIDKILSGRELLQLQGDLYHLPRNDRDSRIADLIDRLAMGDWIDRRCGTYSGGMRRRLDQLVDEGTTVLLSSHYLEEVEALADQLAIIDAGRVIAEGSPDQLKQRLGGDRVTLRIREFSNADEATQVRALLEPLDGVRQVVVNRSQGFSLNLVIEGGAVIDQLRQTLEAAGLPVFALAQSRPSLDDVYLQATGRTLMDAELAIAGQRDVKQEKRQSMR